MIDNQRVGIDQDLTHLLAGRGAVAECATDDARRQRSIAVTAGDLADASGYRTEHLLAPPGHRCSSDQRSHDAEQQTAGAPGDKGRYSRGGADWEQDPRRHQALAKFGRHVGLSQSGFAGGIIALELSENCAYSLTNSFLIAASQRTNKQHSRSNNVRHSTAHLGKRRSNV